MSSSRFADFDFVLNTRNFLDKNSNLTEDANCLITESISYYYQKLTGDRSYEWYKGFQDWYCNEFDKNELNSVFSSETFDGRQLVKIVWDSFFQYVEYDKERYIISNDNHVFCQAVLDVIIDIKEDNNEDEEYGEQEYPLFDLMRETFNISE